MKHLLSRPGAPAGYVLSVALVVAMTEAAAVVGHRQLLFPEYGALCAGLLVYRLPQWRAQPVDIVLYPVAAALIGVMLNRTGLPAEVCWCLSLTAILALLRVARSVMVPSISAALLPILLQFTSFFYPVAVAATTLVLALITQLGDSSDARPAKPTQPSTSLLLSYWVLAAGWGALAIGTGGRYLAAPPILVAAFELMKTKGEAATTKAALLASSCVLGVLFHIAISFWALGAGLTVIAIAIASRLSKVAAPPAFALGLLPLLVSSRDQWAYALDASVGTSIVAVAVVAWARLSRLHPPDALIDIPQAAPSHPVS